MDARPDDRAERATSGQRQLRERGLRVAALVRVVGVGGGIALVSTVADASSPLSATAAIVLLLLSLLASSLISLAAISSRSTWRGRDVGLVHVSLDLVNMLAIAIAIDPTLDTAAWVLVLVPIGQASAVLSVRHSAVAWGVAMTVLGGVAVGSADRTPLQHLSAIAILLFLAFGPASVFFTMATLLRGALYRSWKAHEDLHRQAATDVLTGLLNRRGLDEAVAAKRHDLGGGLSVFFCDLDRFKQINDTLGHESGDEVLRQVARRLVAAAADDELVARLAGDEFVVVTSDIGESATAQRTAQLRSAIRTEPYHVRDVDLMVDVSVGVATMLPADEFWNAVDDADRRMYLDKPAERRRARSTPVDDAPGAPTSVIAVADRVG